MSHLLDLGILKSNMAFVYRMVVASESLLDFALDYTQDEGLRHYYSQHLDEELGHSEMLKNDLVEMGMWPVPRSYLAAQIVGAQYYLIAHEHPCALLGYMSALESRPMALSEVHTIQKKHGLQLKALEHHAIHDVFHGRDIAQQISLLPYEHKQLVHWNEAKVYRLLDAATQQIMKGIQHG